MRLAPFHMRPPTAEFFRVSTTPGQSQRRPSATCVELTKYGLGIGGRFRQVAGLRGTTSRHSQAARGCGSEVNLGLNGWSLAPPCRAAYGRLHEYSAWQS